MVLNTHKKCSACFRIYTEGFKGHCTEECFEVEEYKKSLKIDKSQEPLGVIPPDPPRDRKYHQRATKKANEKWLNSKYVDPKDKPRRDSTKLKRIAAYYRTPSWMKQFDVMRG